MSRTEMELILLEYLKEHTYTTIDDIRNHAIGILNRRYSEVLTEDVLLINRIIWDYISDRILTPGRDINNLDLPYIHVSNDEKLRSRLNQDRDF